MLYVLSLVDHPSCATHLSQYAYKNLAHDMNPMQRIHHEFFIILSGANKPSCTSICQSHPHNNIYINYKHQKRKQNTLKIPWWYQKRNIRNRFSGNIMKNKKLIITGGPGFNINLIKNDLNDLDLINISNEPDHVFHQAPSPGAPASKAIRPMFSALVSARIEEFGLGMPGWKEGRRRYLDERGYFGSTGKTGR